MIFFPQITFPGEKVGVGKICLWCNERGKSFYSTEAVQAHMNDKSHCKLLTDGDAALEFADFYDFRSVWFEMGGRVKYRLCIEVILDVLVPDVCLALYSRLCNSTLPCGRSFPVTLWMGNRV